ncbi:MAG: sulfotransferase [Phycisphaerales bacterium]
MRTPSHPECVRLAQEAFVREDWFSAGRYYRQALRKDRDNADFMRKASLSLAQCSELDESEALARKACKRDPNNPDNWVALALTYQKQEREDKLHEALDRALRVDPYHGAAIHAKSKALFEANRLDDAIAVTSMHIEAVGPHPLTLLIHARVCRALKRYDDSLDATERVITSENTLPRHLIGALFEKGSTLDAQGEYDDAFEAFSRANAGMPAGNPMHADSIVSSWTRDMLAEMPESGNDSERPVFIIGMPRSGTTLTEQIIAAHPLAAGVGELPYFPGAFRRTMASNLTSKVLSGYAKEYLSLLDERAGTEPTRTIDKHMYGEPSLGFVTKVFPNAHFIHCLRDPLDCCLSAYFQNFGANMPVARDLVELGKHYVAHRRLMEHWQETLDRPIYTSVYEDLVADQETKSRELIAHTGLDWDDACLRFHESSGIVRTASTDQVRKPIYSSSTKRWERYEKHLGPLIEALGPYADHARRTSQ